MDDPRLTAYALGELDGAERAAVERTLAVSPEAQAMVDDIRRTAGELAAALAAGTALELTPGQRRAVKQAVARRCAAAMTAAAGTTMIAAPAVLRFRPWWPVAAAAVLAFAACSAWWMVSLPAEDASRPPTLANKKEVEFEASYARRLFATETSGDWDGDGLRDAAFSNPHAMGYTGIGGRDANGHGLGEMRIAGRFGGASPTKARRLHFDTTETWYPHDLREVSNRRTGESTAVGSTSALTPDERLEPKQIIDLGGLGLIGAVPTENYVLYWHNGREDHPARELPPVVENGYFISGEISQEALRLDCTLSTVDESRLAAAQRLAQILSVDPSNAKARERLEAIAPSNWLMLSIWHDLALEANFRPELCAGEEVLTAHLVPREVAQSRLQSAVPEVNFEAQPLDVVLKWLGELSQIAIAVNWEAVGRAGVKRDTPVTVQICETSIEEALDHVLSSLGSGSEFGYELSNGMLLVGPKDQLKSESYAHLRQASVDYKRQVENALAEQRAAEEQRLAKLQEQRRRLEEAIAGLFDQFDELFAAERYADAEAMLGQVLRLDPYNAEARQQLEIVRRKAVESYGRIHDNPFLGVAEAPLSTFSIDVDTASYTNIRRFLNNGQLPPPDAVRIEEMVNFFDYDYPPPAGEHPFAVYVDTTECPWTPEHRLVRVALKGREVPREERPPTNLVFLIDVSGSMNDANKLPLVKDSLTLLAGELDGLDRVAIVVYAGASGLVLPSTGGDQTDAILSALDNLSAGGSTNGGEGIQLAYDVAAAHFIEGGANRVILATDGDFNVGVTDQPALTRLIEEKAAGGVFLSVLGYGMGDLSDDMLETLADRGNGHYAYIDSLDEARRVLVDQVGGTLVTIAKDVKIQIEFNPLAVAAYRLIGYENRMLAARDFNDDAKDAGEIGAGHTVTALYEVVPAGEEWQGDDGAPSATAGDSAGISSSENTADTTVPPNEDTVDTAVPPTDPLRYQAGLTPTAAGLSSETATVKLRYKQPEGDTSRLITYSLADDGASLEAAPGDLRFAAAVASFGMLLRHSPYAGDWTLDAVQELAATALGDDPQEYRAEFLQLVEKARAMSQP